MPVNIDTVKCPQKLGLCPVLNAVVEFRVKFSMPNETIVGILYNELKDKYHELQNLPILDIPVSIRNSDPYLVHKPWHQLNSKDGKYLFWVGNQVLSLVAQSPYQGWKDFYPRIKEIRNKLDKLSLVRKYNRIGIRYTSMFDQNIFDIINLNINLEEDPITKDRANIQLSFDERGFTNTINITNNALVEEQDDAKSIIDIDTSFSFPEEKVSDDINTIIEQGHEMEKKIFFRLIKKEFVDNNLNPEY